MRACVYACLCVFDHSIATCDISIYNLREKIFQNHQIVLGANSY